MCLHTVPVASSARVACFAAAARALSLAAALSVFAPGACACSPCDCMRFAAPRLAVAAHLTRGTVLPAIAAAGDGKLRIWDLNDPSAYNATRTIDAHKAGIFGMVVVGSGPETKLVTGSSENFACIWKLESGECERCAPGGPWLHTSPGALVA